MAWWVSILILGGAGLLTFVAGRRIVWLWRSRTLSARACPCCDHDLRVTVGRTCPECGHTAPDERRLRPRRRRIRAAVFAAMLLVMAVALAMFDLRVRQRGLEGTLPRPVAVLLLWSGPWLSPMPFFGPWVNLDAGLPLIEAPTRWERRLLRNGALRRVSNRDAVVRIEGLWMYFLVVAESDLLRDRDWRAIRRALDDAEPEVFRWALILAAHGDAALLEDAGFAALLDRLYPDDLDDHFAVHMVLGAALRPSEPPTAALVERLIELLTRDDQGAVSGRRLADRCARLGHALPEFVAPLLAARDPARPRWNQMLLEVAWQHATESDRDRITSILETMLASGEPIDAYALHPILDDPRTSKVLRRRVWENQLEHADEDHGRAHLIDRIMREEDEVIASVAAALRDALERLPEDVRATPHFESYAERIDRIAAGSLRSGTSDAD